jgi:hypothetical protein
MTWTDHGGSPAYGEKEETESFFGIAKIKTLLHGVCGGGGVLRLTLAHNTASRRVTVPYIESLFRFISIPCIYL